MSWQIEGRHSSLSDLLLYEPKENPGVPLDEVKEVSRSLRRLSGARRKASARGLSD
jgi:hypothetical protein